MRTVFGHLFAGVLVLTGVAIAQAPSFDVASVKMNRSGALPTRIAVPRGTGRFDVTNARVHTLILNAFGLQDFQVTGGPSWISDARFDITARANSDATRADMLAMLRTLLVERFHLATHRESRDMSMYALVLARGDGKLGPQLTPSITDCTAMTKGTAVAPPPISATGQTLCGTTMTPTELNAGNLTMDRLATQLSGIVGRMVSDETRLTGPYDLRLTFAAENAHEQVNLKAAAIDPNAPSIFAALPEQLGLKLEARRGPVDVLVIDHVELPTED